MVYPLIGDGYCQDEINIAECHFDGGDCCGPCINKEKCSECSCLNNITTKTPPNTLIGDGFCNDETNNANCNYDGGDCCGTCINTERCIECTCLDKVHGNGVPNARVGDGFCNDEYNTVKCFYDGLDCCREPVNKELCSECLCHGKFLICLKEIIANSNQLKTKNVIFNTMLHQGLIGGHFKRCDIGILLASITLLGVLSSM